MKEITYNIDGQQIVVREIDRDLPGWTSWDVFEGDTQLTTADPWPKKDGEDQQPIPPSREQVAAYLHPRRQQLQELMTEYRIVAGADYQYENVYAYLFPEADEDLDVDPPRWLTISEDETYSFFNLSASYDAACKNLASRVGEPTGGTPVGLYDLENGHMVPIAVCTLVYSRDLGAEEATEDDADLAVHRARMLVSAAFDQLESAIRTRVARLVRREYPTASDLLYDGEYNEDGLLHMYVREIRDGDGKVLDSRERPSRLWNELTNEDVEPLLWELSERDHSYYGGGIFQLWG